MDIGTGVVGRADLIEEIVRIYGYDKIPNTIMADEMPPQRSNHLLENEEKLRDILVRLGLRENISYRFTTPEAEKLLVPMGMNSSLPSADYVEIANPTSADKTVLRHTLLINLLENAQRNARFVNQQQIFEIGKIYLQGDEQFPDEPTRLGILLTGIRNEADWSRGQNSEPYDFFDMKGIVDSFLDGLHIQGVSYDRANHSSFHPGRSATLIINGTEIGTLGQLHPQIMERFKLTDTPVFIAELDLDTLLHQIPSRHGVEPLPIMPAVLEDIALVVPEATRAIDVEEVIYRAGGRLLKNVELFDVYRGNSIPSGHKSLAYSLTYQTEDQTLSDKDVAKIRNRIIATAEKQLDAKLRT
jgi:phenylalanyl-tRNA synthetase beta chain